uniref:Ribose 5-phosphate isomerase B n=1 Tax=Candidatus Caldatribacterium saccharofermentans TaxID=1454753 RepID=A0A7V4TJF4_9BACT
MVFVKIAVASDHAGFALKKSIVEKLAQENHEVYDLGTFSPDPVGVGPFAQAVAKSILEGKAERGILVCGTGGGMTVVSNRYPGIRAILCFNEFTAEYARRHNDANILVLGARTIPEDLALRLVDIFLYTPFEGGKYAERLAYLETVERDVWEILCRRFS